MVVGLVGVVMTAVPGLPGRAVHEPVPLAPMVAEPPGRGTQLTNCGGSAVGPEVIRRRTVSKQVPEPHRYVYVPIVPNPVMVEVGDDGEAIVVADGLPGRADHEAPGKASPAIVAVIPDA